MKMISSIIETIKNIFSQIPEPVLWLMSVLIAILSLFLVSYFLKRTSEKKRSRDYLWIIGGITFAGGIFGSVYTLIKVILDNLPLSIIVLMSAAVVLLSFFEGIYFIRKQLKKHSPYDYHAIIGGTCILIGIFVSLFILIILSENVY